MDITPNKSLLQNTVNLGNNSYLKFFCLNILFLGVYFVLKKILDIFSDMYCKDNIKKLDDKINSLAEQKKLIDTKHQDKEEFLQKRKVQENRVHAKYYNNLITLHREKVNLKKEKDALNHLDDCLSDVRTTLQIN